MHALIGEGVGQVGKQSSGAAHDLGCEELLVDLGAIGASQLFYPLTCDVVDLLREQVCYAI
jgi:hypothetical protein